MASERFFISGTDFSLDNGHLSLSRQYLSLGFLTRSDTNCAVQPQERALET